MILEVFSNLNGSMNLWFSEPSVQKIHNGQVFEVSTYNPDSPCILLVIMVSSWFPLGQDLIVGVVSISMWKQTEGGQTISGGQEFHRRQQQFSK